MEFAIESLEALSRLLQRIGPYLLVEILLPGGTLLALLLFLSRSGRFRIGDPARVGVALVPALVRVIGRPDNRCA